MSEQTLQAAATAQIKVTEEELNSVRNLSEQFSNITMQVGELNVAKFDLEREIENKKQELNTLRENENKLGAELEAKYGKGRLNLQDGTYTPLQ